MSHAQIKLSLAALTGALFLGGCASPKTNLDEHFGEAVNTAKAQQTINPDASRDADPVTGLDGQAAQAVMERYHKAFQTPPPPVNVFTIGVGSGGGAMTTSTSGGK